MKHNLNAPGLTGFLATFFAGFFTGFFAAAVLVVFFAGFFFTAVAFLDGFAFVFGAALAAARVLAAGSNVGCETLKARVAGVEFKTRR